MCGRVEQCIGAVYLYDTRDFGRMIKGRSSLR